ncbi:MAG: thiamine pyrophosphate-binding protein [Candidatus Eisenbacteria bacterium]|uniref:Thiamine pyrophosphate-binding protein n=1 Tax=Eiseniibacteriota bacterium TaxID=2212470 RepID=A0A849SEU6_UNCEI|nr:thiamine pyrophosphate-binding protein [Candidatus Eisenbacteria bacterium]
MHVTQGAMRANPMGVAPRRGAADATVVTELVALLERLGVKEAFGVSGGAMAALWDAMSSSSLGVYHFRHENGAAFAAIEASFASGRPTVLFTTTGPGLTNAMTGIVAAREERARVIVLSAYTSASSRGRFAIQETSRSTMPASLYDAGRMFHFASVVEDTRQLDAIESGLAAGLRRRGGFVAHLALDSAVQSAPAARSQVLSAATPVPADSPTLARVADCVNALSDGPFAIWVGFGARDAAAEVAALARRMRAPVMCSPRGKGIFPETDPLFVGVTGLAGHSSVMRYLEDFKPRRLLVLGSRIGEPTSFWDRRFITPEGFVHIDVDPEVPGVAFGTARTLAIVADVGTTLREVLDTLRPPSDGVAPELPHPQIERVQKRGDGRVRPEALMDALQDCVVDRSDATLLSESGNSFLWTTHRLRFAEPHRYRVSTGVGAMGHAAAGVVGAALATGRRAVAVVGDGALLMTNEINTAVKFGAPVAWVVLNDGRYGMCAQGMEALGLVADAAFPQVDFAAFARAQGARAARVDHEVQLDGALAEAMAADGPFVLDVRIDPQCKAPASLRNAALAEPLPPNHERVFPQTNGNGSGH